MSSSTADPLADIRRRAPVEGAWLVGGSVRDMLLGRPVLDIDLVVAEDRRTVAKRLAGLLRGLAASRCRSDTVPGAWCLASKRSTSPGAEAASRTISACAISPSTRSLSPWTTAISSIHSEAATISIGACLRTVSDGVFADDPLRLLRLARIAHELGFDIDPSSERLASSQAPAGVAAVGRAHLHGDETPAGRGAAGGGAAAGRSHRRARGGVARGGTDAGGPRRAGTISWMSGSTRCTSWRRWPTSPSTRSTTCPGTRRWSVPSWQRTPETS